MRKQLIAGNWKMHNNVEESLSLAKSLMSKENEFADREVLICAPFTSLYALKELLANSKITIGAQNMHFAEKGAFTGEISPNMLIGCECKYVIIGHSERREIFGETDELINQKLKAAFTHKITPILCVGESLDVREAGEELNFVKEQLSKDLQSLSAEQVASMVIAYEPIWAIGTGKTATTEQAEAMCQEIRKEIAKLYDQATADAIRIQYGGSVKAANAAEILSQPNIDGALVGGASLVVDEFMSIIKG